MARTFVPDDYATPPLESDEQADSSGEQNHLALKAIRHALTEQVMLAGLCAEYFEHRDAEAFAGALTVQVGCVNALEIITSTVREHTVMLPQPIEAPTDG